jgi:hypothetical protein
VFSAVTRRLLDPFTLVLSRVFQRFQYSRFLPSKGNPMIFRMRGTASAVVPVVFGLIAASLSSAAFCQSFTEEWTSSSPSGWTFGLFGPSDPPGSGTATVTTGSPGHLTIEAVGLESGGAAAGFYLRADTVFSQGTRIRSVLNPTTENLSRNVGLITNYSSGILGPQAYIATITYGGTGSIDISRFSGGSPTNLGALPGTSYGWSPTSSYILEFTTTVDGSLTAQVFDPAAPAIPLATLNATDPNPFSPGIAGLVVQRDAVGQQLKGTFGTTTAAVPEPGSVLLAAGGLALLGLGGWWRKRS